MTVRRPSAFGKPIFYPNGQWPAQRSRPARVQDPATWSTAGSSWLNVVRPK